MKVLNPTQHAALDYGLALAFIFAPGVLGFENAAARLSQGYGIAYLVASLLTRYPLGALRLIPFPVHGVLEALMAISWIAVPWALDFADRDTSARNFFVAAGVALLAVVALTDYRSTPAAAYHGAERRRADGDRRRHGQPVRIEQRRRDRRALSGA